MSNPTPPVYLTKVSNTETTHTNFKDALKAFMEGMRELSEAGASLQVIETFCWIERSSNGIKMPLFFYDARDFGFATGLLRDESEFVKDANEPDPVLVADLFFASINGGAEQFIARLNETVV